MFRRRLAAAALLVGAVFAAGCDAEVRTTIRVDRADAQTITVGAAFTGEAAEALAGNEETLLQVEELFVTHTGRQPQVAHDDERIGFRADITYEQLRMMGTVTGVSEASLTVDGDEATVTIEFGEPVDLVAALAAAATEPGVLEAAMGSTAVNVAVEFPGAVIDVSGDVPGDISGRTVVFGGTLEDLPEGTAVVTGSLRGPNDSSRALWPEAAVAVVATAGGWYLWRHKRR